MAGERGANDLFEYIRQFILSPGMGYGYVFTNAMLIMAAVMLLRDFPKNKKGIAQFFIEYLVCCASYILLDSLLFWLTSGWQMDRIALSIFVTGYAILRSKYNFRVCLVRGWMFVASVMVMLPISEPLGELFASLNESYFAWAQYLTPLVATVMIFTEIWFLRHFSFETGTAIGGKYVWMQVVISAIIIGLELYADLSKAIVNARNFNILVCVSLWFINLMAYYQFYTIDQGTKKNMELNALRQKAEMEKEKYHATKLSYDELRSIRHEIKNHNFYMKALLDEGKTAEAKEYLDRVSSQGTKYLKSFDSGNYAVDVVMNHEMAAAKEQGVVLDTSILVPRKLPFKDEDLCSLLSNLLDNAMEAASQAGVAEPTVNISIIPRQEYLFIRVTNPVDKTLPEKRRMTLETTKTNHTELHGYGTRIIRRIAESYNGSVKYSMSGGIFTTDVMLEMPEEKSVEEET